MKIHKGDLIIKAGEPAEFDYTEVTGSVVAYKDAKLSMPALTSVGGSVVAYKDAKLSLPALTSVGGGVWAYDGAKVSMPADVKKNDLPAAIAAFEKAGYSFADGILARIVSKRGPVTKVVVCGKTEPSYVVTDGAGDYSHGKTIAEARDGLLYKLSSRDTSEFKAWTLDKVVSKRDAIRAYRAITGACEGGVRSWMEQRTTPEKVSVAGIIELTKGAYGHEKFAEFFGRGK